MCHRCALETQSTYICKYIKHKHSFSVSKSQLCPARLRFCKATTVSMSVQPGNSDAPGTAPGTPGRATAPGPEGGRRGWGCEGGPQPGARPPISRPGRARRPLRGGAAKNPWRRRLLSGFLVDEDPFLPPNRKNKNGEGRTNRASERSRGACQGSCLPCRGGEDRAGIGGRVLGPGIRTARGRGFGSPGRKVTGAVLGRTQGWGRWVRRGAGLGPGPRWGPGWAGLGGRRGLGWGLG